MARPPQWFAARRELSAARCSRIVASLNRGCATADQRQTPRSLNLAPRWTCCSSTYLLPFEAAPRPDIDKSCLKRANRPQTDAVGVLVAALELPAKADRRFGAT